MWHCVHLRHLSVPLSFKLLIRFYSDYYPNIVKLSSEFVCWFCTAVSNLMTFYGRLRVIRWLFSAYYYYYD